MRKQEFLDQLGIALKGLPSDEIEERLSFYSEMIDDHMEEGISEEEAVSQLGSIDEIAKNAMGEVSIFRLVKNKVKLKRSLRVWEIILLILGAPLWIPLLVAGFAIFMSVYAVAWAVILTFWACELAFAGSVLTGLVYAVIFITQGKGIPALVMFGAAVVCSGLTILWYFGSKFATKGVLKITKEIYASIKKSFVKGEK